MVGVNLTPIKIPGKNNRDQRRSVITANRSKRPRPPGRPPKSSVPDGSRDSTPSSAGSGKLPRRRSLKNLKSRRKMATLEKLPIEILTPIFLFSMNLGLPRASPIIAGKLSSRLTIVETITNVFSATWDYYYELVKGDASSPAKVAGDPKLQSAMLRCRCATLSTLRQAEEAWLHRTALDRGSEPLAPFYRSARHESHLSLWDRVTDDCWHRSRRRENYPDDYFIEGYRYRWRHKTIDDCFTEDYAEFRQISSTTIAEYESRDTFPSWRWTGFLHVHPDFDIPESLLQGPWTPDMVEYLFWLIRAEARIHWIKSTSGEVAVLGLKNAISTGNLQIIFIFQYLRLAENVTLDMVKWAFEHAGGDKFEVIARLMSMYLYGGHRGSDSGVVHLQLAGELSKMRLMAHRQKEGSQDKVDAIAVVDALDSHWAALTGLAENKIVAKGWSIVGDRILH